ncbi:MAG: type I restriction enzyme HsdR N-terminal domain-containing protein [Bacteroidales bacterium]|nr:type I restriction enzyme HsdR N-terminal domain-containing protein [Bacteroidales bacterium]
MNILLPFPPHTLRVRSLPKGDEVFDIFRKKWVRLTTEEYIRQQFLHHMLYCLGYPQTSIAVEKTIQYHKMIKRFDALIVGKNNYLMLLEFKRPEIVLNENVILQASAYAHVLAVRSIFVTNGIQQFFLAYSKDGNCQIYHHLPSYDDLIHSI